MPSLESGPGVAVESAAAMPNRSPGNRPGELPLRVTAVALQAGSPIGPEWPEPVADAPVNATVPKFASGSGRQPPRPPHDEGDSAIHSAEDVSGDATVTVFVNDARSSHPRS